MSKYSHRPAFTLVELLTVIAIIGILAGLLFGVVLGVFGSATQAKSIANLKQIGAAAALYQNSNNFKALPAYDEVDPDNEGVESWLDILAFVSTGKSGKPKDYTAKFTDPEWRMGVDPEYKDDEIGIALNVQPGLPHSREHNDNRRGGKHFSMSSIDRHPVRLLAVQWDSTEITGAEDFKGALDKMIEDRGQQDVGINYVCFDGHTETTKDPEKLKNAIQDPAENLRR